VRKFFDKNQYNPIIFAFLSLFIFTLIAVAGILHIQTGSSRIINEAGRLRMLTQKISKQYLILNIQPDNEIQLRKFNKVVQKFDSTLKLLEIEIILELDEIYLPGFSSYNQEIISQLRIVQHRWISFKNFINENRGKPDRIDLTFSELNENILYEADLLVKLLEQFYASRAWAFMLTLLLGMFVSVSLILSFAWKKIQSNLRDTYSLVDATRKISLGDYDVDLKIGSNMETRILAESISEMSQKIESILGKNNDLLKSEKNLNKQKNRLISIIAHDLRGPFSGLMVTSELLAKELSNLDPEKVQHLLVRMNSTIISIFDLLEDLLSWANSESNYDEIKVEELILNQLVSDLYSLFKESANNKGIELINEIPVDLILYSDQYMTNTIFRNLLSNALKFSNKGGTIKISARRIDEYVIEIAVSDSGIGMEPNIAESIFNFDEKYSTHGTFGELGTGLGLSLCKEFAEKCGGGIEVESKLGIGTTFTVKIDQSKILHFDKFLKT